MLTKSQLRGIFLQYGLRPLKRLGQNYLIDGNIKDKIIGELAGAKGDTILEIGPGFGALTEDIAASGAGVYAVEKDKKGCAVLRELLGERFPNLKLIHQDILKFDLGSIHRANEIKVVGNLPYYITTPIIELLFRYKARIKFILITVQRELANRLLASPGTKDYGSISCFIQYHTKPKYVYTVKRTAFYPEPEVDSSIIRLDVLKGPPVKVKDEELFFKVVRGAFNQRRKSIINSLSREEVLNMSKERLSKLLKSLGISPQIRPESLSLADFSRIADAAS